MMKKTFLILFLLFFVMVAVLLAPLSEGGPIEEGEETVKEAHLAPVRKLGMLVPCLHFEESSFLHAISMAKTYEKETEGLQGGIVPHHLLASNMIASFWKTVSQQSYDLIVLIGPDHEKKGNYPISTISTGFSTQYGDVFVDKSIADRFILENLAGEDAVIMEKDHAISCHMPFVRYYMPDIPILPFLVKGNCDTVKIGVLSDRLREITNDRKVLYVASIDFSHYLPLETANQMDASTEQALAGFEYEKILKMTNDHLDSRPSALFMLYSMENLGAKTLKKWEHSNSDIIAKTITGYTTSYFTFGFYEDATQDNKEAGNDELRIIAVGDIMLGRGVAAGLKAINAGYLHPFMKTADLLKRGDVVFGNLEHPITSRTESLDKNAKYVFKAEPEAINGLTFAGFSLLSLANNHIMDYYEGGLLDTMDLLRENDIAFAGAGRNMEEARRPAIITKKGLKIGLLAYTDMANTVYKGSPPLQFAAGPRSSGVAPSIPALIEEDIKKIRQQVDLLIVSVHWGIEDSYIITDQQVQLAHRLIDLGADMILGHHPHRFQGIEIYQQKPIIYSLGNFIFDQSQAENQESFIVDLTYAGTDLTMITAIPVRTEKKTQVVPQTRIEAQEMMDRFIKLSDKLGTQCEIKDGYVVIHNSSR